MPHGDLLRDQFSESVAQSPLVIAAPGPELALTTEPLSGPSARETAESAWEMRIGGVPEPIDPFQGRHRMMAIAAAMMP